MSDLATTRRRLPTLWADSAKVYVVGASIIGIPATTIGILLTWGFPRDQTGYAALGAVIVDGALLLCLVFCLLMARIVYSIVQNIRSAWCRIALGWLFVLCPIPLFPLNFDFSAALPNFLPLAVGLAVWTPAFFLMCRAKLDQVALQPTITNPADLPLS